MEKTTIIFRVYSLSTFGIRKVVAYFLWVPCFDLYMAYSGPLLWNVVLPHV